MNINRYDPWQLMNRLHQDVAGRMLGDTANGQPWSPPVDIREEADKFLICADLPGVDPKNMDITMEKGVLRIHGSRETRSEEETEGFRRLERPSGTFERWFRLPEAADTQGISADYHHGVLTVSIPKQPVAVPRRIEVQLN